MRTQEQAFKAYYASMSDAELLAVANNRTSFIATAQKVLAKSSTSNRPAEIAVFA